MNFASFVRLVLAYAAVVPALQGADWLKLRTAHFEMYTTALEPDARQTLETLERAHDFFRLVQPGSGTPPQPVTVVQFRTAREYAPYRLLQITPAFMAGDAQNDFIVIGDVRDLARPASVHEYVHVLVKHSGLRIPRWLNEGMADVYSTFEERDGRIVVGSIPSHRSTALASTNWMRLSDLVAVTQTSPEDEAARVNAFYAQSWLLTHMLMFGDGYAEKFPAFLQRVSAVGSQAAIAEVYGKSLAEMQTSMNAYFRGASLGGQVFEGTLAKVEIGEPVPAPEIEVELALARITGYLGKRDEAVKRLEALAAQHPGSPEIQDALQWARGESRALSGVGLTPREIQIRIPPSGAEPLPPEPEDDPGKPPTLRRQSPPAPAKKR